MRGSPSFVLPLLLLALACDGHSVVTAEVTTDLRATPPAFQPGETVLLRPVFADGSGSIEPDVGKVESGRSYEVGPAATGRQYKLVVRRANGVIESTVIDVPLQYHERVVLLTPSPLARSRHGAATLADGRVLLVGGRSTGPQPHATAETLDADGVFRPVGDLSVGRVAPQVVALADGSALTFGGAVAAGASELATRVEQWDPAALAWSVRGDLACSRQLHSATRLVDGSVLVAGGEASGGLADERDAEIWVPGVGSRQPAGGMLWPRAGHSATMLADGRVLLAGGYDPGTRRLVRECELYDPALDAFTATGPLLQVRAFHAAVPLRDGRVLVAGGAEVERFLADVELYDPATGLFTAGASMGQARSDVAALRLGDGSVLVAGGGVPGDRATDRIEVFEPTSATWRAWATRLPAPRTGHSLSLLPDARVAVLGGDVGRDFPLPTAWILD